MVRRSGDAIGTVCHQSIEAAALADRHAAEDVRPEATTPKRTILAAPLVVLTPAAARSNVGKEEALSRVLGCICLHASTCRPHARCSFSGLAFVVYSRKFFSIARGGAFTYMCQACTRHKSGLLLLITRAARN
mmetsp:Transcript_31563/g.96615  ORF Transcript_31563/g.96615 Transcript_31563/m.96615 type:complete len:133 (-) Transcript_31563:39-437(-)|eukprot:scaffold89191_cov33-Tisochrysis_lutea.AAC.3